MANKDFTVISTPIKIFENRLECSDLLDILESGLMI